MKINISRSSIQFCLAFLILFVCLIFGCNVSEKDKTVRFGVCADPHRDIMHDVDLRLRTFVRTMNEAEVDFIIQLGDFCHPQVYNEPFLDIWDSFDGPAYHVLGNHDMDNFMGEKFSKEHAVKFFGMGNAYYSFKTKGFHFIILDANETKGPLIDGSSAYIGSEQKNWLKAELESNQLPALIFSHRSFLRSIKNGYEVRLLFEQINNKSPKKKVIACFNAHYHLDQVTTLNGIYYIDINSMSYHFLGRDYISRERYGRRMDKLFYKIQELAPYKDPLFAVVTVKTDGSIIVEGVESEWVGPSPQELGCQKDVYVYDETTGQLLNAVPRIANRYLKSLE